MNNSSGEKPHSNPMPGDLWYNTLDNNFYVFEANSTWDVVADENSVFDLIIHEGMTEDPIKAYDRAMGVI